VRVLKACLTRCKAAAAAIGRAFGVDEILLTIALALIGVGMRMVWAPGAYLVPGAVLLWIALPQRAPFVARAEKARRDD
jgi:hypothetical protein